MRKKDFFKLLLILVLFFTLTSEFFPWKETTHKGMLTPEAIKLFLQHHKDKFGSEIELYKNLIVQGSHDEDFPTRIATARTNWPLSILMANKIMVYLRANNHYRHAISGSVLTGAPLIGMGDPDLDALTWAKTNGNFSREEEYGGKQWWAVKNKIFTEQELDGGNMSWPKAINRYGYTEHSKTLAYYTLGFVLHLLQDMGVPEHVHDDPHGGSGYTGFEKWVEVNWEKIVPRFVPKLDALRLKRFGNEENFDIFFTNLAKIAYSANRFSAQIDEGGGQRPTGWWDLDKMFKISFDWLDGSWKLENYRLFPIPDSQERSYFWNPHDFKRDPKTHKGGPGDWWPTHLEMAEGENDVQGFYYIEFSDELPPPFPSLERYLYPKAYLPTPLPSVADQCEGWKVENCKPGTHVYQIIGERVFPKTIEHCAGLLEYFGEIVDHPPYVQDVKVLRGDFEYFAYWKNIPEESSTADSSTGLKIKKLEGRELISTVSKDKTMKPGSAKVTVTFSEPVQDVQIKWDNSIKNGAPVRGTDDKVWQAEFEIKDENLQQENATVSVKATDKDKHYAGIGGELDTKPETPARRKCTVGGDGRKEIVPIYEWEGYENTGLDSHYVIKLKESMSLKVHVQDVDKAPIPGARITAQLTEGEEFLLRKNALRTLILKREASNEQKEELRRMGPGRAVTDAAGNAELPLPSGGNVDVEASAEGYEPASTTFKPGAASQNVTLTLHPSGGQGDKIFYFPKYVEFRDKNLKLTQGILSFEGASVNLSPSYTLGDTALCYVEAAEAKAARKRLISSGSQFSNLPFPEIIPWLPVSPHAYNEDYVVAITCNGKTVYEHYVYLEGKHDFHRWGHAAFYGLSPEQHKAVIKVTGPQGDIAEFPLKFLVKRTPNYDSESFRSRLRSHDEYFTEAQKEGKITPSFVAWHAQTRMFMLCNDCQEGFPFKTLEAEFERYAQAWLRMTPELLSSGSNEIATQLWYFREKCENVATERASQIYEQGLAMVEENTQHIDDIRNSLADFHLRAAHLAIASSNNVQAARKHLERALLLRKAKGENVDEISERKRWPKMETKAKRIISKLSRFAEGDNSRR